MSIEEIIDLICSKGPWIQGKTIGLTGPLGVGKTHLVKHLLEKIDTSFVTQVSSPSFTVCNIYNAPGLLVRHFDFYRLKKVEELEEIGFFEYLDQPTGVNFIEWVDLFDEVMNLCDVIIRISMDDQGKHQYSIIPREALFND